MTERGRPRKRALRSGQSPRNPRVVAALVIQEVLGDGRSLGGALDRHLPADDRDQGLVQELSYGSLRYLGQLRALAGRLLRRPLKSRDQDLQALILVGLYQLWQLRVADHAAVAETVQAAHDLGKSWGAGLVNAVLRGFQRRRGALLAELAADERLALGFPEWLRALIEQAWPGYWREILRASNQRPPMSLRVNPRQLARDDYLQLLQGQALEARLLVHTPQGLTLERPLDPRELPGFDAGLVSVQDGGAQLAAPLLEARPGQRVLDACAAPGGKACQLQELADNRLRLTALDRDGERLAKVGENLRRLGLTARLVVDDAAQPRSEWGRDAFDRILVDAPCSATGTIRRHPDLKWLRRPTDIASLADLQGRILDTLWPLLRPGGTLLYVTCSLLPAENEQQLQAFLGRHADARAVPIAAPWGHALAVGRQVLPGEDGMDGFYFARARKLV